MPSTMKKFNPIQPTPGRNEPCSCGSSKKYKQCCLQKDQEAARQTLNLISQIPTLSAQSTITSNRVPLFPWLKKNFTGVGKYRPVENNITTTNVSTTEPITEPTLAEPTEAAVEN